MIRALVRNVVAAIGAVSIALTELVRGERTATCLECGRLHDVDVSECPDCGGDVTPNYDPSENGGGSAE